MPLLGIVVCSTRPGRVGPAFGAWLAAQTAAHGEFEPSVLDLADFNLPIFDEPNLPMLQEYTHEHTRRWARAVSRLDAIAFVTPEYNQGPPPSALNALSFLCHEWAYMPAAFLSYGGGAAGGARAVQAMRLSAIALRMAPIPEVLLFPFCQQALDGNGALKPAPASETAAKTVLDELSRLCGALAGLRSLAREKLSIAA